NGCVATSDTIMVSIFDSPIVDLGADTSICEDAMLPLDAGNAGAAYAWSTGDTVQTIMVMTAGTYDVTVTSPEGCETSDSISVGVDLLPIAGFTSADTGLAVTFTSTASNADSVHWDFGGGNTSNEANPSFTFDASGTYTVTQVAFNDCGTDTISAEISVIGVSIDDLLSAGSLSLYPNPTSGSFVLQLDLLRSAELRVEVVNLQGQRVHLSNFGQTVGSFSHAFDMPGLAEGIYLVKIQLDNEMVTRKLQVE
ncbi:MAG: T9SS C-terminal target domain-containing protein, partial [Bacteroidetes bacterium]